MTWRSYRWELRKLVAQRRTYLGLGAAFVAPILLVVALRIEHPDPSDPSASFFVGMIAVCGMGSPSGRRNSAVTANQSASAPTIPASAMART